MNTIQPIETVYNGYRFRSRLEARWAVFFDTLNVPYVYEPEGFEFDDGVRYLPDFWLPSWGCWAEVKPQMNQEAQDALARLRMLAEQTDALALLLAGDVWPGRTKIVTSGHYGYSSYTRIVDCRRCDGICLLKTEHDGDMDGTGESGWSEIGPHTCGDHEKWPVEGTPRITGAYRAARQARFEFGERRRSERRPPW